MKLRDRAALMSKSTQDEELAGLAAGLLDLARYRLESAANASSMDREFLEDLADDIGDILVKLEEHYEKDLVA